MFRASARSTVKPKKTASDSIYAKKGVFVLQGSFECLLFIFNFYSHISDLYMGFIVA